MKTKILLTALLNLFVLRLAQVPESVLAKVRYRSINTIDVIMGLDVAGAYFKNIIRLPTYRISKTTQKDPKGFSKAQYGF